MTTVVMTGGTSGIGAEAARRLAAPGPHHLLLGARRGADVAGETLPLDLARLESVRGFASSVREHADDIGALVLNAGVSRTDVDGRTVDGFETTFAVNHLGHYLLLRLLVDRLASGAVVVLTTSGTHDPARGSTFPAPRHADAWLLAHPEEDPGLDQDPRTAGHRAYSASKLCAVLTARAVASTSIARERRVTTVAYDPGPTPGTGLAREESAAFRFVSRLLGTPIGRAVPMVNSRSDAGGTLAGIAVSHYRPPAGAVFASLHRGSLTWPRPSDLALDDDAMRALWRDSADLVGVSPEVTA